MEKTKYIFIFYGKYNLFDNKTTILKIKIHFKNERETII